MRFKKRRGLKMFAVAALLPMMAMAQAGNPVESQQNTTVQQITARVRDFLANVPKNDPKVFQDFFADDVIYTRSAGVTVTKADILKNIGVRATNEPNATYEADDFTVHPYGSVAIVNFRLIQHNEHDGKQETNYFRNTGTFLKRNGKWQVVAWQATKVPPGGEQK